MAKNSNQKTKKIYIIAGAAAVIGIALILFFLFLYKGGGEGDEAQDQETRLRQQVREEMEKMGIPGEATVASMERALQTEANPSREKLVEEYELFYRYPPNSRPLDRRMTDLIRPLDHQSALMPVFRTDKPIANDRPDYVYQFKAGPSVISSGTPFVATLEVYDARTREKVKPEILSAKIVSDALTGQVEVGEAHYGDDGKSPDKVADDRIFTFSWTPPYAGRLYWGGMSMVVKFKLADRSEILYKLSFESSPSPPAVFTGRFEETLKYGSLVIKAELDVKKTGHYIIESNLFHKSSGEPVHYVIFNDEIETPGKQWIELLFFGKVFRDKDLEGRFVMRNLRGFRDNIDYSTKKEYSQQEMDRINAATEARNEPVQWYIPPHGGEYTTESYEIDQFSDAVFDGPEKQQKLKMLESMR